MVKTKLFMLNGFEYPFKYEKYVKSLSVSSWNFKSV